MKLFEFLAQFYYCTGLMIVCGIVALGVSIRNYDRHKKLRVFTWYILLSLCQDASGYYSFLNHDAPIPLNFFGLMCNIFMIAEYLIFTLYMLPLISSAGRKWAIRIIGMIFLGLMAFIWIRWPRLVFNGGFFLLECMFLVPPCLIYFYEIFVNFQPEPLKNRPSFWIITGVLFLNACSILLLLTADRLGKFSDAAFSLNYILYCLLFLLIIRAYLCPSNVSEYPAEQPPYKNLSHAGSE